MRPRVWAAMATVSTIAGIISAPAHADPVADFYKGKIISLIVAGTAGGIYSNIAQTISRHLGQYIPGNPTVIVQHMPGAGGIVAINHAYNIAPKDGTVLLTPNAGLTKRVVLGEPNIKYEPTKFHWLGAWGEPANDCTVMKATSPALTIQQAIEKEVIIGSIGTSSTSYTIPLALNNVLGTKFKLVSGYGGGSEVRLAMERGEVHGFCGQHESWTMGKPDWLRDGKLVHLVQFTSARTADMPDTPTAAELARTDEEREILRLMQNGPEDRAIAAPPGVPADRLAALEKAYMAMLKDPKFVEDANRQQFDIRPTAAKDVRAFVERLMSMKPETVEKLKKITGAS